MNATDLFNEDHEATYCPEDDKIRLYVGRVPRDEYEALRAEGWKSTPKQDCDFVAVWTVARENTALAYAGTIGDEDQSPQDRAADRAERFAGYRDKRTSEAIEHADHYDAGPAAHGFQSKARAVKAADRHDRHAGRAVNCWEKAEYWTRRTAGVIDSALYKSRPDVRMGRIKKLESQLRKAEKSWSEATASAQARFDSLQSVIEHAAGTREKVRPMSRPDFIWCLSHIRRDDDTPEDEKATPEQIRRAVVAAALGDHYRSSEEKALSDKAAEGTRPAADIAAEWMTDRSRPEDWSPEKGTRYTRHLRLRLAYENQMLEAQGGRAAHVEMEKGGTLGKHVVAKVNKSNATGRVVSVAVIGPAVEGWQYMTRNIPGTPYALHTFKTERMEAHAYNPPTPESLAKLAEFEEARKAAKAKAPAKPRLLNPTDKDAERLQAIWNKEEQRTRASWEKDKPLPTVKRTTQADYSANSKGSFASFETVEVTEGGSQPEGGYMSRPNFPTVAKVRATSYGKRVVILTDKPQKPLPAATWKDPKAAAVAECKARAAELLAACSSAWTRDMTDTETDLFQTAQLAGLAYYRSQSQFGLTDEGQAAMREAGAFATA